MPLPHGTAGAWPLAASAFLLVALNEFGDKSQLVGLLLAGATGRPVAVFWGLFLAMAALDGAAVLAGDWLRAALPARLVLLASGALFAGLGAAGLLLREAAQDGARRWLDKAGTWSPFLLSLTATAAAEMGDRTQLAAAALAAGSGRPWPVLGGTVAAVFVMSVLTVAGGSLVGRRVPAAVMHKAGALCLLAAGGFLLYQGLAGTLR